MIEGGLEMELVQHLLASGQTRLVPIPSELAAKVASQGYVAGIIPAGTFNGQPNDVPTTVVMNFLVTRERVSDDVAYIMTKSLFDHLDQLIQTNPVAKDIDAKKAIISLPIPLHRGAERYYREIGIIK
jgi:TRAP transporter TAXI family solute receptor